MKNSTTCNRLAAGMAAVILSFAAFACVDDGPVAHNNYSIGSIAVPDETMDPLNANDKRVHIGHEFPVDVTMSAEYPEAEIPLQFYLLHTEDVDEVERGIADPTDIRMYYAHRLPGTIIPSITAEESKYRLVVNIPSENARDELTNNLKTGSFYVVAEVDKDDTATVDAYTVYERFRDKINPADVIEVTSDYMSKPDLSIYDITLKIAGNDENGNPVAAEPQVIFAYTAVRLDPDELPGLTEIKSFTTYPSDVDRTFTVTARVKSSASDALNVPVKVYVTDNGAHSYQCEIYDRDLGGWVDTYYIPLLKANVEQSLTLATRMPKGDVLAPPVPDGIEDYTGAYQIWELIDPLAEWVTPMTAEKTEQIGDDADENYAWYRWTVKATINESGSIQESRFVDPETRTYEVDGDVSGAAGLSSANNADSEDVFIMRDFMNVQPNEGINVYPYDKITSPQESDRTLVIFWDGLGWTLGNDTLGATAAIWEGAYFYNYSYYSMGVYASGFIFGYELNVLDTHLNAESHPNNPGATNFDLLVSAAGKTYFTDGGTGFSNNVWEYPITLVSEEYSKSVTYYCFVFTVTLGLDVVITPGISLDLNSDGSLELDKNFALLVSAFGDASASILGLAGVGLYTYADVLLIEFVQRTYTETEFNPDDPDEIRGFLYRNAGLYLTGPTGYIDLYLFIKIFGFEKRWSWTLWTFACPRIPIFEFDFKGSGKRTTYQNIHL